MNKRTFVISELMQNNFIEETEQKVLLEETEESGKSLLKVQLPNAQKIFCIKNVITDASAKTKVTATPIPTAVSTFLETPKNGHIPKN